MALKWLRDQMKFLSWILWGIVITFIVALFFDFGSVNLGPNNDQVAATVGSEKITYEEFQRSYTNLESRYRQMFGQQWSSEMAEQFNLHKQALDMLVDQRIRLMEAERMGLAVSDEELQDLIVETFSDEEGNFLGRDRITQTARYLRMSEGDFVELLRQDALAIKLSNVLASTLYISDQELERKYREDNETATIRFVQLPASEMAGLVTATDEEIQAYYNDNSADYELPEQRSLDYILVDTVKLRREIEIPDDEIQAYWEANPSEFEREEQVRARHILIKKTPDRDENAAKAEIEAIRARVESGEDFAALAQELSEDEGTASRGGNLGYFSRGQMVEAFESAAFGAEAGSLVGPVVSSFGVHLIEVQDKRAGGVQPLDQAKPGIRARLLGERVDQIARDKSNEIAKRITDEKLTTQEQLQALAEEEGVTLETTDPFGQGEAIVGIGRVPELDEAAFSLDAGAISDPIKVPRGWVIVRVAEILEPRVQDLSEVEDTVRQAVETEKQKDAAVERLAQARAQKAEDGDQRDLQTIADELGLEVTDSAPFGLQGNIANIGRNPAVNQAALSMDVGELSEPIATNTGAVLFEVVERKKFDPETFEAEKADTLERERQQRSSQILDAIVEERRRDLVPKYDARLVEEYGLGDQST